MLKGRPLLYTMTALNALSFLLFGYDQGVVGGVDNSHGFLSTFKLDLNKPKDNTMLGTIVSMYDIGAFIGSILCSLVGERIGRRYSLLVGTLVMLVGTAWQAASSSSGVMIGARIFSGIGIGFIASTAPVLQSEISPPKIRGRFICVQLTVLNLGVMIAYWAGYGASKSKALHMWRIPVACQACFQIPILFLIFIVPESPRWLASHGKVDDALKVVARLKGLNMDSDEVRQMHDEIIEAIEYERQQGSGGWKDLLKNDKIKSRRRFLIACSIQFFQQLGGQNALTYYSTTIMGAAGLDPNMTRLISGVLFTWFFIASFIPWVLIDRVGRRKLLLSCITGMVIMFACEAGVVLLVEKDGNKAAGSAAVAFLFVYMALFTIGFQAVVWAYPSEILPLALRQKGSAISTACNWIFNYMVVQITPIGIKNIGYKFYIVFAIINACFLPPIYFFYPETAGLSLESVDKLFASGNGYGGGRLPPEDSEDAFQPQLKHAGSDGDVKHEVAVVEKA
ncbi:Sugar transporter STL1 [Vanrija pseudolonga]|uniref:Sugar transporter STL1 n=1 Tax=Vanrija pseudolonga TaxID=143232 RepID=A0AAF0YII6_9TREE|nr:Sugar transporter STL1 [Vanrija pseudolonga]